MASMKSIIIMMLVFAIALESANCYFRLGRELNDGPGPARRSHAANPVLDRYLGSLLAKVASCVKQVSAATM